MKRLALSLVVLAFALTSCYDHPDILRRLPDETAALIPYQMGDTLHFLNGLDTIVYVVTSDEIGEWNGEFFRNRTSKKPQMYSQMYCCARNVILTSLENDIEHLCFVITPEKTLYFYCYWLDLAHQEPEPRTVNGITYDEVYSYEYTDSENNINEFFYYTLDEGMIAFKQGSYSLSLIP